MATSHLASRPRLLTAPTRRRLPLLPPFPSPPAPCSHRDLVLSLHMPAVAALMPTATFLLRRRADWPSSGMAAYALAVVGRPLVDATYLALVGLLLPVSERKLALVLLANGLWSWCCAASRPGYAL